MINRIVLEGNQPHQGRQDHAGDQARAAPDLHPLAARADVARIIELYRRQGRYAASVEPQDRPARPEPRRRRVRDQRGAEVARSARSTSSATSISATAADRSEMATREHVWYNIFSSRDTYDPDRLAYDQQKLRQFYLTQGYADFRVVSAVAELTPDRRDFIITYVVEEGQRYKFGDVDGRERHPRLQRGAAARAACRCTTGDWYNAKQVEDTVTRLNELRRPVRLCLRRRAARVQPRRANTSPWGSPSRSPRRRASMSSGSTSTATPRRATR